MSRHNVACSLRRQLVWSVRLRIKHCTRLSSQCHCSTLPETSRIELIKQHTVLSRDHLTPELAVHVIDGKCPLWKARPEDAPFPDPFWAFYWPGGQALTRCGSFFTSDLAYEFIKHAIDCFFYLRTQVQKAFPDLKYSKQAAGILNSNKLYT